MTRRHPLTLALCLCPLITACASTELVGNAKAVEVPTPTTQLTIDPNLLVIQPLTPLPIERDGDALAESLEIVHNDAMRDRGHLRELIGAEKQREHSQAEINKAAEEQAQIKRNAITEANKVTVKVRKPLLKRLF